MYYFDNEFLQQYVDLRRTIKVTVDGEILTITDKSDIKDPTQGTGYDAEGNPSLFNYMDIQQIQVGPNIITLDKLQTMVGDEEAKEKPASTKKPPSPDSKKEPEEDDKDKEPDLAHYSPNIIGRLLVREFYKEKATHDKFKF
jgi:hypothetical protein